jgi:deoxyhypusine synthase
MEEDESHEHVVPGSDDELTTADVRGYDFRGEFDFHDLIASYETTGFQAAQLAEAVDIAKQTRFRDIERLQMNIDRIGQNLRGGRERSMRGSLAGWTG